MDDLSLFIQDIVENSLNAKSNNITLKINENPNEDYLIIEIIDDGIGMDQLTLKKVTNPFYTTRTTRKVGLGLSFFKESVLQTGGDFQIRSTPGLGTYVYAKYISSHIDMPPVGDIALTIQAILVHAALKHFVYLHRYLDKEFHFDTHEIMETLEITSFTDVSLLQDIKQYITDLLKEIRGGRT